jgi:type I restriction enzyme M protein
MAIAEDIGYDAAGKPTAVNELETVASELARFLAHVEDGDKRPFA